MAASARKATSTRVYLEVGAHRVFACAIDWPGWLRSGKNEESALQALVAAAPRFAPVAEAAGLNFSVAEADHLEVVERVKGTATTDFGAPASQASGDAQPLTPKEIERINALVAASWKVFDRVVASAPLTLRKGPRGGGRDRDQIVDHVLGAESAYAPKFGVRLKQPNQADLAGVTAFRNAILDGLRAAAAEPLADKRWPPRYAARRIAWHALDHAWEIEDRS